MSILSVQGLSQQLRTTIVTYFMLKIVAIGVLCALCLPTGNTFNLVRRSSPSVVARRNANLPLFMGYVPDGMTSKQWAALKKKEEGDKKKKLKFDGTSGMKFRSRSFAEFQKGRESTDPRIRQKFSYNMPMEKAKEKLAKGLIKPEDVPYMQRPGGMPDNSDLKKGFRLPWQK